MLLHFMEVFRSNNASVGKIDLIALRMEEECCSCFEKNSSLFNFIQYIYNRKMKMKCNSYGGDYLLFIDYTLI